MPAIIVTSKCCIYYSRLFITKKLGRKFFGVARNALSDADMSRARYKVKLLQLESCSLIDIVCVVLKYEEGARINHL